MTHFGAVIEADTKQGIDDEAGKDNGHPTSVEEYTFTILLCLLGSSQTARTIDWVILLLPFDLGAIISSWYSLSNLNVEWERREL